VKQEKISIPSVPYAGLLKNNVAYIRFNSFTENSAIEFGEALKKLALEAELKGIIVDLRGNPGGLLNDAVRIVNYFIPKDLLIVETKGKVKQWNAKYIAQAEPLFESTPLVVLVNRGSASASEIVSGALQDLDRAVVIGERTYGKGLVQTTRKLVYNTRIKVTTAKYYIPSGRCIQALDYSHRNIDGSVSHIPDSLITKYFTKNGRVVYDGGGILPDLIADTIEYSLNFKKMMSQGHLFDFATEFSAENVKILEAKQFFVSDSLLNSFYKYLTTQNFEFESKSNAHLASLEKELIAENRLSEFNTELDLIRSKLDESKYLLKEKDAIFIKKYLGSEIVSRYFYQRGRIQYHIRFDDAVSAALSVLADQNYYKNILNGEVGEHKIEEK
ncbi:MAG: peptidase S41, partial [Bacteroidales bacterium]|nr:peptidase S41 [Bacteroidales bacterium]